MPAKKTAKTVPYISHDAALIEELREDPAFAAEYLRLALADSDDQQTFLLVLRQVAEARGMAKIAKAAGIQRESLYRALSPKGNPRLSTLMAVFGAMGVKLVPADSIVTRATKQKRRDSIGTKQAKTKLAA